MSNLESLEVQVKGLNSEELRTFRNWFLKFDGEAWDRQFENDARSGKLDRLAQKALRDYDQGLTTEL